MYAIENHKVSESARAHTHLDDATYQRMYRQSLEQPDQFWAEQAERFLTWDKRWSKVHESDLSKGQAAWFIDGKLNVSVNCIDRHLAEHGDEIAGIIMEPINYNQGCIVASPEYMQFVRDIATDNHITLIYDEVLSAFRTGPDCGQGYYGVSPDVCVIGKAVANGAPIAVIAGKKELMDQVGPGGEVAQSGTYSGNTIGVLAALATLEEISKPGFYDPIYQAADRLYTGLTDLLARAGIPARVQGLGARFGILFGVTEPVTRFEDTFKYDAAVADSFMRACAGRGVYFHSYGTLVVGHHGISAAHSLADIDEALNRIESALGDLNPGR